MDLQNDEWIQLPSTVYVSENKISIIDLEGNAIYSLGFKIYDTDSTEPDGPFSVFRIPGYPIYLWVLISIITLSSVYRKIIRKKIKNR